MKTILYLIIMLYFHILLIIFKFKLKNKTFKHYLGFFFKLSIHPYLILKINYRLLVSYY